MTEKRRVVFDYNHGQKTLPFDSGFESASSSSSVLLLTAPPASITPPEQSFNSLSPLSSTLMNEETEMRHRDLESFASTSSNESVRFFDHDAEFNRLVEPPSGQPLIFSPRTSQDFQPLVASTPCRSKVTADTLKKVKTVWFSLPLDKKTIKNTCH